MRVNSLLLHRLDLERLKLLVKDLTQVHDHTLVNLLPQVRTEDLDERDLKGWNLAVHENTRQIKLDLETDIHVGMVDGQTPP